MLFVLIAGFSTAGSAGFAWMFRVLNNSEKAAMAALGEERPNG